MSTKPMISYAQNGEDVVLERLFSRQLFGRYIDVGASHPIFDSVTKHFYDRGWRGINVEPDPRDFVVLAQERPEDTNLQLALADHSGRMTLYVGPDERRGLSTLDPTQAQRNIGDSAHQITVEVATLASICREHELHEVEFLKIDVEGSEAAVIAGTDWSTFRPRVVVVESVLPNTSIPSYRRWDPMLERAGYRLVLFDGLNRFYVQETDLHARAVLAAPANILDNYRRYDLELALEREQELKAENDRHGNYIAELQRRLEQADFALTQMRMGQHPREASSLPNSKERPSQGNDPESSS